MHAKRSVAMPRSASGGSDKRECELSLFDLCPDQGFLVVYVYPKDNTPGCTREAQHFHALSPRFAQANAAIVGVSRDSLASHQRFQDKFDLSFPLISDTSLELHQTLGAWGEKSMYGRTVMGAIRSTFVLRRDGQIIKAWPRVAKVDAHADAVLDFIGAAHASRTPSSSPKP